MSDRPMSSMSVGRPTSGRPASARSRNAWGDDSLDDGGLDNPACVSPGLRAASRLSNDSSDDIVPAAMESELYDPNAGTGPGLSNQTQVARRDPNESGCWYRFKSGIRGKILH